MITRTPFKAQQVVKIMTDPNPQLVSLVGHGANQTPFLTVKSHTPMPAPKTPTQVTKGAEVKTEIHKMVFSGDKFANVEAVNAYLTEKGLAGGTVEQLDKDFVVKGIDESAFVSIAPVAGDDGVTQFIGELVNPLPEPVAEPAAKAAETTPPITARTRTAASKDGDETPKPVLAIKADGLPEKFLARKVDTWYAYYDTNDTTLAGVLADANDGIPVGFYDIESVFIGALCNLVLSGDIAGITALCAEFGGVLVKLATLTASSSEKSDRETAIKSLLTRVPVSSPAPAASEPAAPVSVPAVTTKAAEAPAAEPTLATLAATLETITKQLADSQAATKKAQEEATKANERASKLEQIRQTRKSHDAEEVAPTAPTTKAAEPAPVIPGKRTTAQKMDDNLLGLVH